MSGESIITIWEYLAVLAFFILSLVGMSGILMLAYWKGSDIYVIIRQHHLKGEIIHVQKTSREKISAIG